jgi:molybdopterin molybdotransferase
MPAEPKQKLLNDCFLHDQERLRHDQALQILRQRLTPIVSTEFIDLADAANRIAAQEIRASQDIPAYTNSAVDGYAYAAIDNKNADSEFPVSARIAAGENLAHGLAPGNAARIFTGAALPDGADTIAMQEDCRIVNKAGLQYVRVPSGLKKGANVRLAGEDLRRDEIIVAPGQVLAPQFIAAIASTGIAALEVYRPLKIAILSSGNEIKRPGESLATGQVYDANHFLLRGLLASLNMSATDLGILPDHAGKVRNTLQEAATSHDVIISTGGASLGEEDHFVSALDVLGKRHLWQLAIKPGRPMCFGQIGETAIFCLPGNPVAAFVCFLLYIRPALYRLGGSHWPEPHRFPVTAGFSVKSKKSGRREFWRGWLEYDTDGPVAHKFERDGSGLISGLRKAHGLIEVPEDIESVAPGDRVAFIPFSEFGLNS